MNFRMLESSSTISGVSIRASNVAESISFRSNAHFTRKRVARASSFFLFLMIQPYHMKRAVYTNKSNILLGMNFSRIL